MSAVSCVARVRRRRFINDDDAHNSFLRRKATGRSEEVIGDLAKSLQLHDKLFLATKVWTHGREAGIESMERSFARFRTGRIDLMQVHNLVDVGTHLQTMRDLWSQGRFRYIGVT